MKSEYDGRVNTRSVTVIYMHMDMARQQQRPVPAPWEHVNQDLHSPREEQSHIIQSSAPTTRIGRKHRSNSYSSLVAPTGITCVGGTVEAQ